MTMVTFRTYRGDTQVTEVRETLLTEFLSALLSNDCEIVKVDR